MARTLAATRVRDALPKMHASLQVQVWSLQSFPACLAPQASKWMASTVQPAAPQRDATTLNDDEITKLFEVYIHHSTMLSFMNSAAILNTATWVRLSPYRKCARRSRHRLWLLPFIQAPTCTNIFLVPQCIACTWTSTLQMGMCQTVMS